MKRSANKTIPSARPQVRPLRSDGQVTREQLLNTAGLVFAESGYDRTTSKAICERAKANLAAVNYHFGSKNGLYEAVLAEAHRQLIDAEELEAWVTSPGDARARLKLVLGQVIMLASEKRGWAFPVLLREILSPSPLMPTLAMKTVRPKAQVLIGLMSEIMDLAPDHPSIHRCVFMCIIPCMLTAIAPPALKTAVLPSLIKESESFVTDFLAFAFAGIDAVAVHAKRRSSVSQ